MRTFLLILILAAAGWYGYPYYRDHAAEIGARLVAFGGRSSWSSATSGQRGQLSTPLEKCITEDGRVVYGTVPPGVVCVRREVVEGAFTVVPSAAMRDGSGTSVLHPQPDAPEP